MAETLLKRILFTCRHEFSWPRRTPNGSYYQVCLQCGTKYRYDWSTMRRGARIDSAEDVEPAPGLALKPVRNCGGRHGWHPRERRLRVNVPVLYRCLDSAEWFHGQTENISRSGLLFSAEKLLPLETELEMIFEMPEEICGVSEGNVLCRGRVARTESDGVRQQLAAAIADYEFIPKDKAAGM